MPLLKDKEGNYKTIDASEIKNALEQNKWWTTGEESSVVAMKDDTGNLIGVPFTRDQIQQAVQAGYTFPGPDEEQKLYIDKKYDSPWKAGILGAARGLSFGLSDEILTRTGAMSTDELQALKEANPDSSLGGEIAGMAAPVILSGGTGLAAKGGFEAGSKVLPSAGKSLFKKIMSGAPSALLDRSAAAIEKKLAERFAVGESALGRFGGRALSRALPRAGEGAVYGASQEWIEHVLENRDLSAENALVYAGIGAGLGGAASAAIPAVGEFLFGEAKFLPGTRELAGRRLVDTALYRILRAKNGHKAAKYIMENADNVMYHLTPGDLRDTGLYRLLRGSGLTRSQAKKMLKSSSFDDIYNQVNSLKQGRGAWGGVTEKTTLGGKRVVSSIDLDTPNKVHGTIDTGSIAFDVPVVGIVDENFISQPSLWNDSYRDLLPKDQERYQKLINLHEMIEIDNKLYKMFGRNKERLYKFYKGEYSPTIGELNRYSRGTSGIKSPSPASPNKIKAIQKQLEEVDQLLETFKTYAEPPQAAQAWLQRQSALREQLANEIKKLNLHQNPRPTFQKISKDIQQWENDQYIVLEQNNKPIAVFSKKSGKVWKAKLPKGMKANTMIDNWYKGNANKFKSIGLMAPKSPGGSTYKLPEEPFAVEQQQLIKLKKAQLNRTKQPEIVPVAPAKSPASPNPDKTLSPEEVMRIVKTMDVPEQSPTTSTDMVDFLGMSEADKERFAKIKLRQQKQALSDLSEEEALKQMRKTRTNKPTEYGYVKKKPNKSGAMGDIIEGHFGTHMHPDVIWGELFLADRAKLSRPILEMRLNELNEILSHGINRNNGIFAVGNLTHHEFDYAKGMIELLSNHFGMPGEEVANRWPGIFRALTGNLVDPTALALGKISGKDSGLIKKFLEDKEALRAAIEWPEKKQYIIEAIDDNLQIARSLNGISRDFTDRFKSYLEKKLVNQEEFIEVIKQTDEVLNDIDKAKKELINAIQEGDKKEATKQYQLLLNSYKTKERLNKKFFDHLGELEEGARAIDEIHRTNDVDWDILKEFLEAIEGLNLPKGEITGDALFETGAKSPLIHKLMLQQNRSATRLRSARSLIEKAIDASEATKLLNKLTKKDPTLIENLAHMIGGVKGTIGGLIGYYTLGGITGAGIGALTGKALTRPLTILKGLYYADRFVNKTIESKVSNILGLATKKTVEQSGKAAGISSNEIYYSWIGKPTQISLRGDQTKVNQTLNSNYQKIYKKLSIAAKDPRILREITHSKLSGLMEHLPSVGMTAAIKTNTIYNYLLQHAPAPVAYDLLGAAQNNLRVPTSELRDWFSRLVVASNPFSVLDSIQTNNLTKTMVETLDALYPEIKAKMAAILTKQMLELQTKGPQAIPQSLKTQFLILTGMPWDKSYQSNSVLSSAHPEPAVKFPGDLGDAQDKDKARIDKMSNRDIERWTGYNQTQIQRIRGNID